MSNTLPRTRSMSAASSNSLSSMTKERIRPISLCDSSYQKITGVDIRSAVLQRIPSQANNLCTTVPTSLVTRNLGGRHTPTRSSLRHSRMVVHSRSTVGTMTKPTIVSNGGRDRRWVAGGVGRVGVLVISAQTLVGAMAVTLAVWFLLWAPALNFTDVPHYAGVPVFLAGIFGAILISCFDRRRHRTPAAVLKGIVAALCCISILACACVCTFTAMHLIYLAPMSCRTRFDVITHPATVPITGKENRTPAFISNDIETFGGSSNIKHKPRDKEKIIDYNDRFEGSGYYPKDLEKDDEYDYYEGPEIKTVPLDIIRAEIREEIMVNVTSCICHSWGRGNRIRTLRYEDLSCIEVKNILPILFVASCVVNAVGAILSGMILYLLWTSRNSVYNSAKPSEVRPFIFTSNFKKNSQTDQNGTNSIVENGNTLYS